jgi:cytochrome b involved in lipid metabolism
VTLNKSKSSSKKVILEPGYSPLDWAAISANPNNQLRGAGVLPGLLRVTPSMLKVQNGRKGRDAWTSYQGKIYNVTPYLPYHPGGKEELIRGAGKDSEHLFKEIHPWVNWDSILSECLVGILVSEGEFQTQNSLAPDEGQEQIVDKINDHPNQLDWSETGCSRGMQKESTEKEKQDSGQLEKHFPFQRHGELMQEKEPPEKSPPQQYLDDARDQMNNENNTKKASHWILEWTTLTVEEMQIAI